MHHLRPLVEPVEATMRTFVKGSHDGPRGHRQIGEDVTGNLTASVFRDAIDHSSASNIHVSPLLPGLPEDRAIIEIRRNLATIFVLDFSASINSLGTITFTTVPGDTPKRLEQYLWPLKNKRGYVKLMPPLMWLDWVLRVSVARWGQSVIHRNLIAAPSPFRDCTRYPGSVVILSYTA